jgi:hypothetical protein
VYIARPSTELGGVVGDQALHGSQRARSDEVDLAHVRDVE